MWSGSVPVAELLPADGEQPVARCRSRDGEWWLPVERNHSGWFVTARRGLEGPVEASYRPSWLRPGGNVESQDGRLALRASWFGAPRWVLQEGSTRLLRATGAVGGAQGIEIETLEPLRWRSDAALLVLLVAHLVVLESQIGVHVAGDGGGA